MSNYDINGINLAKLSLVEKKELGKEHEDSVRLPMHYNKYTIQEVLRLSEVPSDGEICVLMIKEIIPPEILASFQKDPIDMVRMYVVKNDKTIYESLIDLATDPVEVNII